jgi:hypothetical protein
MKITIAILSMFASAGIAALFLFLYTSNFFPNVSITLWIAAAFSVVILAANMIRLAFPPREGCLPCFRFSSFYLYQVIIGAMGTVSFTMMALASHLNMNALSALILIFFSAMFFAYQLIQLALYTRSTLKQL